MIRIASRLVQTLITMFVVSVLLFLLIHAVPGNPALTLAGPDATRSTVAAITREYHLNAPLTMQFWTWLIHLLHGNLGTSIVYQRPVSSLIAGALGPTLQLIVAAMIVSIVVGVTLGVLAATRIHRLSDAIYVYLTSFVLAIPVFWLGLLALLIFSVNFRVFPSGGYISVLSNPIQGLRTLALPALTLGIGLGCVVARFVRASMLSVLNSDYIRTARAKGLRERTVLLRHALRNAMIPVVTVLGVHTATLIGGAVVVEAVFARPGMGSLLINALNGKDYPVVQAVVLLMVLGFCLINLLIDLSYGWIDPRTQR